MACAGLREGEHAAGELVRLLEMRKVAGALDGLELRAGNERAIAAAVALAQDAVGGAPQEQGRQLDAVQPVLQLRIVHVGRPCDPGMRFLVARRGQRFLLGQGLVVALAGLRIEKGERVELGGHQRPDIDDVAGLAVADLDADGVGHHEPRQPRLVLHRDLGRDPAAEADADHKDVVEIELFEQVEIEVRKVVDRAHAFRQLRGAEARMRRRDDAAAMRERVEHGRVRRRYRCRDAGTGWGGPGRAPQARLSCR